jgi:predicted Zn-dependent protease
VNLSVAAAAMAVWAGCATNPVTGSREFNLMSEAQEIAIGQELDPQVRQEMGVYRDENVQRYVEELGLKLARSSQRPDLPWHFTVVDVTAVNAFALPGGYIYITRGLLSYLNDEAELVGVLGHEIGHVTARHAARQYSRATGANIGLAAIGIFFPGARPVGQLAGVGAGLLFLKYSRDDELQADRLGAEYAVGLGWDPQGVPDLLTTLARIDDVADRKGVPSYLATHPDPLDRVERIAPTVSSLTAAHTGPPLSVNRAGYLEQIDGLVVGDNPEEGVLRGSTFLHPDLRFALDFPEGWQVSNSPEQVVARLAGQQAYLVLDLIDRPRGRDLEAVARNNMADAGFRQTEGGGTTINGLDAYVGTFQGSLQSIGRVIARAAFISSERRIYRLVGFAPPTAFEGVSTPISRSQRSFRALGRDEAAGVRPNRLAFHTVGDGETWQSIAQGPSQGNVQPATLAIMNSYAVNEQPRAGDRIKIVVQG